MGKSRKVWVLIVLITSLIIPCITTAITLTPGNAAGVALDIERTNPRLEALKG